MARTTKAKITSGKDSKKKNASKKTKDLEGQAKKKRDEGVKNVKDKIHESEKLFSEEIDTAKTATKSFIMKAGTWLQDNRQMILGVLALALGLWRLREFILGVILVVLGVLLVSGYFKKEQ